MKTPFYIFLFLILLTFPIIKSNSQSFTIADFAKEPKGNAKMITGAEVRSPQEATLLMNLYRKGILNEVVLIARNFNCSISKILNNSSKYQRMGGK